MDYHSAIKKSEIVPFVTAWMDLEGIMLSEISQRKTNTTWFHLYVESKEQNTHKKLKQTHRHRQQTNWGLSEQRGIGGLDEKSKEINKYKLEVTK